MNDNFISLMEGYARKESSLSDAIASLVAKAKATEAQALQNKGLAPMVRYLRSQGYNYTHILTHLGVEEAAADALVRVDELYPHQIHAIKQWVERGLKRGRKVGLLMRGDEVLNVGVFYDTVPRTYKLRHYFVDGGILVCCGGRTLKTEIHYLDHLDWWATAARVQLPESAAA